MVAQNYRETGLSGSSLQRDLLTVERGLRPEQGTAIAWQRVRLTVEAHERLMGLPPARREAALSAARFQQAAVGGASMEELVFRWCGMADAMLDLLTEFLPATSALRGRVTAGLPQVDDVYQVAYCDDCGSELSPAGDCACGE